MSAAEIVQEARTHIDELAQGVPETMAAKIRAGENDDPRTSLIVRLADEVERLSMALADARRALNGGYNTRALNIINKAEGN